MTFSDRSYRKNARNASVTEQVVDRRDDGADARS